MTDADKIADLLLSWEEARERGESITAEELCGDCPELLDTLRERIRLLKNAEWMRKPSAVAPDKPRTLAERYSLETLIGEHGLSDAGAIAARTADWAEAYRLTPHGEPVLFTAKD